MNNHSPDNIPEPKASSPLTREMEEIDANTDRIQSMYGYVIMFDKYHDVFINSFKETVKLHINHEKT